jgi:hypothetical protein
VDCLGAQSTNDPRFNHLPGRSDKSAAGIFNLDRAIHKKLPVPGPSRADVLDVEPDVRSAIAQELVIPLRSLVELVGAFDVIEKKGSGPFRGRRNQVIQIDVFKPVIGAQPHDVMLESLQCLFWCRLECISRRRLAGLSPISKSLTEHAHRTEFHRSRKLVAERAGSMSVGARDP